MKHAILTLVVAIAISAVAAFYSIAGLVAIFSAAAIPIIIMGVVLEIGKLVTASWLYHNWKTVPFLLKTYLTTAVVVLMVITSMGIFGFLSKAHLDQTISVGDNTVIIERLEQKIAREQRNITDAETVIAQLDQAVQVLMDYDRIRGDDGAIAVRQSQREERTQLELIIDESQDTIDELEGQKLELSKEQIALEAEVGPIKYIAELVYEDGQSNLDEAVRGVILLLVFVFDPLAVLLLIAANMSFSQLRPQESVQIVQDLPQESVEDDEIITEVEDAEDGLKKVKKRKGGVSMEYFE